MYLSSRQKTHDKEEWKWAALHKAHTNEWTKTYEQDVTSRRQKQEKKTRNKMNCVHVAAAAWAMKKKWVNRYKAISSRVVFLLWPRASLASDVRKYCFNIEWNSSLFFCYKFFVFTIECFVCINERPRTVAHRFCEL